VGRKGITHVKHGCATDRQCVLAGLVADRKRAVLNVPGLATEREIHTQLGPTGREAVEAVETEEHVVAAAGLGAALTVNCTGRALNEIITQAPVACVCEGVPLWVFVDGAAMRTLVIHKRS
jgi:hypothetical protein